MRPIDYTVGKPPVDGFYIQIPWHLRGAAAELMTEFQNQHNEQCEIPDGCLGFEFRDNQVQIQRHTFPWKL